MKNMLTNLKSKILIALSTMTLFATNALAVNPSAGCKMEDGKLVCDAVNPNIKHDTVWTRIFDSVQGVITGVTGVLTIVMIFLFIWKAFDFAKSSNNPSERSKCITGMIVYCIAAALFGASTVIVGLMFGVFNGI